MKVDWGPFMSAFGRDVDFHDDCCRTAFLNRRTGEVVWIYQSDEDAYGEGIPAEDNRATRQRVAVEKAHFLEIPGCSHGDHHAILQQFLDT